MKGREPNTMLNFWGNIDVKSREECWNWQGSTTKDGYGMFTMYYKTYLTHRLAWKNRNGDIPKGLFVLHKCDNPKCCNPEHLFLGTQKDNMKNKSDKGRCQTGSRVGKKYLTDTDAMDIKILYDTGDFSQRDLGRMFDVTHLQIYKIIHGKSKLHLKNVPIPKPKGNQIPVFQLDYDEESVCCMDEE